MLALVAPEGTVSFSRGSSCHHLQTLWAFIEFLVLCWVGVYMALLLGVQRKGLSEESLLWIKSLPEVRGQSWRWVVEVWEGGTAEPQGCH